MRHALTILAIVALAGAAWADWQSGDPFKMHFPQLPDPTGYDIDMTKYTLADDWMCTQTGPVSGIHFWYSVRGDFGQLPVPQIAAVNVSIHSDIPVRPGGYSIPGALLGSWKFDATQFRIAGPWPGQQGWDTPEPFSNCEPNNHVLYWQLNIPRISDPVIQQEGKVYWLDLNVVPVPTPAAPLEIGWKTSREHFRDWAVYSVPTAPGGWEMISVCTANSPTDLAFVVTPEPATMALLGLGGLGMLIRWRRSRL